MVARATRPSNAAQYHDSVVAVIATLYERGTDSSMGDPTDPLPFRSILLLGHSFSKRQTCGSDWGKTFA